MGKRNREQIPVEVLDSAERARSLVSKLPIPLQDAMQTYFEENPSMGEGDLRAELTLEAIQRMDVKDSWTIGGKKLGRASVMDLMIDLTASGYSLPSILQQPGFPKPRTYMNWLSDYKVFSDAMEIAERMRAIILAEQALDIVDLPDPDGSQTLKHKIASDLRIRLAEIFNPKKYGKKQMIDVQHHEDMDPTQMWGRFISILTSYKQMIYEKTGIKIVLPDQAEEIATTVDAEVVHEDLDELGMEGASDPVTTYDDMLEEDKEEPK